MTSVATDWLGTPYRLGGTLPTGIDCSGFLLRCLEAAWGIRLPRHSTDQIPDDIVSRHDRIRPGDAVILREPAGWTHVGLVGPRTRAGTTVFHAATTQGRVVVEPLDGLVADHDDVGVVRLEELIEYHGQSA